MAVALNAYYFIFALLVCTYGVSSNEKGESIISNGDIIHEIAKLGQKISDLYHKIDMQKEHMEKVSSEVKDINKKLDLQQMLTQVLNQKIDTGIRGVEE